MQRGSVVISKAGHDKGKMYVLLEKQGSWALLCDGKTKKLSNPKRKNLRHLENTGLFIQLDLYNPLYDAHIKKELKGLSRNADVETSANMLNKKGGCYLG